MNRLLLVLSFSLMFLGIPNAHARNSAATYDTKYWSQQEFVQAYNDSTAPMYRDYVVGLEVNAAGNVAVSNPGINPNASLGQYITESTGSTTDNIYVFGIVDDTVIPAGQMGRICIRGAHKVVIQPGSNGNPYTPTLGAVLSQCKTNVPSFNGNPAINGGFACPYTTATGTAGGMIGYVINTTATTDTGDVGQSTNAQNFTTSNEYWTWVEPQTLR